MDEGLPTSLDAASGRAASPHDAVKIAASIVARIALKALISFHYFETDARRITLRLNSWQEPMR